MEFQAEHILLSLGNQEVQIRYYGIIIVAAMLVAAWIASRLAERTKRESDHIWGALTWAIFPGIVFARLWFVLFPPVSLTAGCSDAFVETECINAAWFFSNFFNTTNGAIAVWSGGLHIFGAVIGGLLGMWLYFGPLHNRVALFFHYIFGVLPGFPIIAGLFYPVVPAELKWLWWIIFILAMVAWLWHYLVWGFNAIRARSERIEPPKFELPKFETDFPSEGMAMSPWLDIAAVALPLAQALGRWANFINQELYGTPTDLPWGIAIDANKRVGEWTAAQYQGKFHPLFLYESLWNLVAFFVLYNLYTRYRDRFQAGDFFLIYLAQYTFVRFFLEFIRIEKALVTVAGMEINSAQAISLIVFLLSIGLFFMRRNSKTAETYEESVPSSEIAEASA